MLALPRVVISVGFLTTALASRLGAQTELIGRVYDSYSRAPLAGAEVAAGSSRTLTDSLGAFRLPCAANLVIDVTLSGYARASRRVADCREPMAIGLSAGSQDLNAVHIVATREAPGMRQPLSVSTLSRPQLTRGTGLFLDDALATVPGVRFERRTMSGGQRLTIRGYGNRTNFDGSGYKAYLNGIPVTDAEGVTMLDDVDFATLGQVDVIRGPASSLYGAGIAGVLQLSTLRPESPGTSVEQTMLTGADGLLRHDTRVTSATSTASVLVNYGHQAYDSYRLQSAETKDHVAMLGDFRPSDRRTITTFLTWARSYEERAGQLDSIQYLGRQNVAEAPYVANDGHLEMESVRVGVTHALRLSERVEPVVTAYFSGVRREDVFAVGLNPRSNQTVGMRALVNTRLSAFGRALVGTTGGELERTTQFAKSYPMSGGTPGGVTTDLETATMQASVFSQWEAVLPAALTLTAGASVNFVEYGIVDRLTNSANPAHRDLSGRQVYDPVVTPRLAVQRSLGDAHSLYASWSRGFTPSTASDAVIAFTGEPNRDLRPERGSQLELGAKGRFGAVRLSYQLALFELAVDDKLTSQGVFDTLGALLYSYTTNAGSQRNRGAELALTWQALRAPMGMLVQLQPFASYAYSAFTYTHFASDNNANAGTRRYDGNDVVGVPKHALTAGVDALLTGGFYGNATVEHRGTVPLTYDNVHSAPAYTLVNAKAGWRRELGRHVGFDAHVGAQNLTGALYYTMVFLNGNYAGAPPKVYLPGPYRSRAYGGIAVRVTP